MHSVVSVIRFVCVSVCLSVCLSVCRCPTHKCATSSCKQYVSKTNLLVFAKFTGCTPYTLPWKWLTSGANHIYDV